MDTEIDVARDAESEVKAIQEVRKRLHRKEASLQSKVDSVLDESEVYRRIINRLVSSYSVDLDTFSSSMDIMIRDIRSGKIVDFNELQLEMRCIALSQALYNATEGLSILGGQTDVARMRREQKFAEVYKSIQKGTIPDKKAEAEEFVVDEKETEAIFQRAYQSLSAKIKAGNSVLEAVKKVLTARMVAMEVFRKELNDALQAQYGPRVNPETEEEIEDEEERSVREQVEEDLSRRRRR